VIFVRNQLQFNKLGSNMAPPPQPHQVDLTWQPTLYIIMKKVDIDPLIQVNFTISGAFKSIYVKMIAGEFRVYFRRIPELVSCRLFNVTEASIGNACSERQQVNLVRSRLSRCFFLLVLNERE
jgi:hypothetical protein